MPYYDKINQAQKYLTKEGLERLQKELEELKTSKRLEIARRIQEAKSLGDLSENAQYKAAKEAQAFNEGRIEELEEIIRNAEVIKKGVRKEKVQVGSTVKVESKAKTQEFTIVGSREADPLRGKISNESPLGKAFLGHQLGERVDVKMPSGKVVRYKIIDIL